jgi:hypothetical protein
MDKDYRHLQRLCERQVGVTGNPETRKALEDLADEYRKLAEAMERGQQDASGKDRKGKPTDSEGEPD